MDQYDVLDHGFVRLVDVMGDDAAIVRAARVSYANDQKNLDNVGNARLIAYMMANGHTSPFEHVTFTFHVKAPIFVFRQWQRHRTWSYNEMSSRYTELPDEFYLPDGDQVRAQSKSNKQGRDGILEDGVAASFLKDLKDVYDQCYESYANALGWGVARELARLALPVATYSMMYATVDLHNLFRFLALRLDAHAQYEIRVYAIALAKIARDTVPLAWAAWRTRENATIAFEEMGL